jgi:multidrug efflux pump
MSEAPRYFGPTRLAVRNRSAILALFAIIAILGISAYGSIPKESSPEITMPMIAVSTAYPGVAPKDMETLVTRVIEDELNRIPEIKQMTSTTDQGYSVVIAEFYNTMNMEAALQKVREKVDLARPKLPSDARDPVLREFNFSEFPIMQVNISGEYDLVRLKDVAEELKDRLEQIPALLDVRLSGGLEREVRVDVDLARLKHYGVAFGDVIDKIRSENVTIPGGAIDVGSQEFLVRIAGEFEDTRIIEDIVVALKNGAPVYVRDIASVDFGFRDRDSYARLDGNAVVTLDIVKRSGQNIIETADAVRAAIAALEPTFPPTTVVKITGDQSEAIHDMVTSLENNIISGLILVIGVLLFFLGVRNATFVGISIPMSMLLSFIIMKTIGISMNMVVLFSLILALGMLVDNAIVVVENIYRHMEQGFERTEAALRGAGEVAVPIISSTLTTLAAFLPLLFWPDIMGEFMGYLPKTLIITLSSSLFVALVIVPTLCAMFMRLDGAPAAPMRPAARWTLLAVGVAVALLVARSNPLAAGLLVLTALLLVALHGMVLGRMARVFQVRLVPWMTSRYERRLRWALAHRAVVLAASVVVFVGTIMIFMMFNHGVELFPERIPPSQVFVRIDVPSGTSADFTNDIAGAIERQLHGLPGMEDSKSVVTTVGGGGGGDMFSSNAEGSVAVSFVKYDRRTTDVFETLGRMQRGLGADVAGASISVERPQNGPPTGKPVTIEIIGPEVDELKRLSDRAIAILKASPVYPRLEGLDSDMARGRPELVIEVDREIAALYELSTSQIGSTIRTAVQGTEAAKFRTGRDEYDIMVRLAQPYRDDLSSINDLTIMAEGGRQIPLPSVASWRVDEGLGVVKRKDLDRVATIVSDVRSGEQTNSVLADVRASLADFEAELPGGYMLRYTGQQEEQEKASDFLGGAFLAALLLIGLILVSQFNSLLKPVIIMTSVIMSTVGVLLGLIVFGMPFGIIMTGVGVISLAGIVVNNAIVLIDYIDLLRTRDGLSREDAVIAAGLTRFRPVILTAVTTVLGLLPLATGFNFDFLGLFRELNPDVYWGGEQAAWWGPMAIAVIAGLSFATLLTLVMVPVLYSVLDDVAIYFARHYVGDDTTLATAQPAPAGGLADAASRPGRPRSRIAALTARIMS